MDLIPEPAIVVAALKACRRVNDDSLTTRILETVQMKCGNRKDEVWPYLLQVSELNIASEYIFSVEILTQKHGRSQFF